MGGRSRKRATLAGVAIAALAAAAPALLGAPAAAPDDPGFPAQWGLFNTGQTVGGAAGTAGADIRALEAWGVTTGSERVRVAVLDTGVDYDNPDLAPNVGVVNPDESGDGREANGVDDDGNGLIDDWRGWDFAAGDNDPREDGAARHGTPVAGVIGARGGDGVGVAGVSWSSRIIPVRVLSANQAGTNANIAAGIRYAAARGARILNASFGGFRTPDLPLLADAIAASPDMLVVAAAGNAGSDNDLFPRRAEVFPCNLALDNVVCVAASDQDDALWSFSNFGIESVDLAAPGVNVVGLAATGTSVVDGTSFAAPHVSGVAALVLAANPGASTLQLRGALLAGVHPLALLASKVVTGGRLDAAGALAAVPAARPGPGGASGPATRVTASSAVLNGTIPASGAPLSYHFEYGTGTGYGAQTATRPVPPGPAHEVSEPLGRLAAGTTHHARLVVAALDGITVGDDVAFTTAPAPAIGGGPLAPAGAGVAGAPGTGTGAGLPSLPSLPVGPSAPAARPRAGILHLGDSWFATVRLSETSAVTLTLGRRVAARRPGAATSRLLTVRHLERRRLRPGSHRIALGHLAAGRYRLTLRVVGPSRTTTLVRPLLVPPARPRS